MLPEHELRALAQATWTTAHSWPRFREIETAFWQELDVMPIPAIACAGDMVVTFQIAYQRVLDRVDAAARAQVPGMPDYFAALTAWRKFAVRDNGRVLVSANHPIPWTRIEPDPAVCLSDSAHPPGEPCPALRCSCGYYAYKSRDDARQHSQGLILARVELWGRIAQHTRGYRAEHIRLCELIVPHAYPAIAALAARYPIPVTEGDPAWTSENLNASSLLNQSVSQWYSQQNMQILPYLPSPYGNSPQLGPQLANYAQQQALQQYKSATMSPLSPKAPFVIEEEPPAPSTKRANVRQVTRALMEKLKRLP